MKKLFRVLILICVVSPAYAYVVGDVGPGGGYVFYVDGIGDKKMLPGRQRYLEAAPYDASKKAAWSSITDKVVGTSTAIGKGQDNTKNIMRQAGPKDYSAAKLCAMFVVPGTSFRDWFLPSKDELDLMYNVFKTEGCLADLEYGVYWSSSEDTPPFDDNGAWNRIFLDSGVEGVISWGDKNKKNLNSVRCVRAF